MAGIIKIKAIHTPPEWTNDASFVFLNIHGDQWVAALRDEGLIIGTSDPGEDDTWREFSVSTEELRDQSTWRMYPGSTFTIPSSLARVRLEISELLWIGAVLYTVSAQIRRRGPLVPKKREAAASGKEK